MFQFINNLICIFRGHNYVWKSFRRNGRRGTILCTRCGLKMHQEFDR